MLPILAFAVAATAQVTPTPDPYVLFARARHTWLMQTYPRAVSYIVSLQTLGSQAPATRHYESVYVSRTNTVFPNRVSLEQQSHPHVPTGINISIGPIPVGPREETPDPFGVPSLAPNYSFGIAPRHAELVEARSDGSDTRALIGQLRAQYPDPMEGKTVRASDGLKEIGNVVSAQHDYFMQFVGVENDAWGNTFHIALQPTHEPWRFRLRDVWIDSSTYQVHQLMSEGNFIHGLAARAQWLVKFAPQDGVEYISSEQTLGPVSAKALLGASELTWDGWRVSFEGIAQTAEPYYLHPSLGDEAFLSEPD